MTIKEFLEVFTVTDAAGGRKIKATTSQNDMSDILTTSDPTYGRRIKIDLTGYSPFTVVANYSALPLPADATGQFYWCEASQGTKWLPFSWGGTYYPLGMYYSNGITWTYTEVPFQASQSTVDAGTVTDQFVSPETFENAAKWNEVIYTSAGLNLTNISATFNSNNISLSVAPSVTTNGLLSNINISAGITSNNLSAFTLNNSNGVSFGLAGSVITATVATNYQSQGAYLTTAMASNRGTDFVQANAVFAGTNASGTIASNGVSVSVNAGAVNFSAGTTSNNLNAVTFSNLNGISFGLNGSVITGSHNGLTTAMASDAGSRFVNASAGLNLTNISATFASNSVSLSVANPVTTNGLISAIKISAGTLSSNRTDLSFNNSNGISFGLNTDGIITATVATNYQSQGAYLTTAMASNRGTDFVQANAAFAGTNASGTIASNGISISVNAGGGGAALKGSGTYTQNTGTIEFANSNGITFGLSNNGTFTASHNGLTTAMASNRGSDFMGTNTALTANGVSMTANSSGLSLNFPAFLTTAMLSNAVTLSNINISAGTTSQNLSKLTFDNAGGVTFGMNGSVITASAPAAAASPINFSAGTTSGNIGSVVFSNLNGVSFGLNGSTITASAVRPILYDWANIDPIQTINQITNLTATGVTQRPMFFPVTFGGDITWNRGMFELSKVTNSQNYQFTFQFGLYSFANSTSINLIASLQNVYDLSSASSVSITGIRRFAFDGIGSAGSTITPGHYVAMMAFSAGAGGTSGINASLRGGLTATPPLGLIGKGTNALSTANLSTIYLRQFQGLYSTTSNVAPSAVRLADVRGWTTAGIPFVALQST